jgi:hypothetical protein
MDAPQTHLDFDTALSRRDLLRAGLLGGAALSASSLYHLDTLWAATAGQSKRGGILRVRGYDPVHFDHHQTINFKTNTTLSFPHSTRTPDLEARRKLIFDIQRYIAEQQYYVFTTSGMITGTWQPYVKNYGPNLSFDYGGRTAALWLDK